jgi:uncharacterized protein YbcI
MMVRPLQKKSRGQIESEISDAITKFEKEHMGRGPLETKTYLIEDMVVVRLKGVLTKAEHALVKSDRNIRARELVKQVRIELIESGRSLLEDMIKAAVRRKVKSIHTDISTVTGEKMIVFILDRCPDFE